MREILFRGKTEDGLWRIGYLSFEDKITIKRKCYDYKGDYITTSIEEYKIDKNTIGQFTGLTDKNGKKIFEGDIVKIRRAYLNAGYEEDCFYKVAWHKYWNGWALINIKYTQSCYLDNVIKGEIIGNIHDNKELLGE